MATASSPRGTRVSPARSRPGRPTAPAGPGTLNRPAAHQPVSTLPAPLRAARSTPPATAPGSFDAGTSNPRVTPATTEDRSRRVLMACRPEAESPLEGGAARRPESLALALALALASATATATAGWGG